ncbi:ATP-dependent DNA helicase RecG [Methanocalculus alkaliphilus]|uniref:RNA-binding domain-containing protein n=1 Tax=Methanocalculus alkaliphilus TaxID=768730 RepID=UPI00209DC7A5|nr:RNA-binding domain-containing protein [Methanocalculus alkaliphilus]MCP1714262.1 ATP-dependent DNA helicase RecG [Methanocalculus alkaliphilus]
MRTADEVLLLLDELDTLPADDLEDQDLDFKEWNNRSRNDAIDQIIEYAICMANGGGGTIVFGISDKVVGRNQAIFGVPPEIDTNLLRKAIYDSTDPKITPVFEEIRVPEGTGRLILMQIHPGFPPYTDTSGRGKIRIGKDCQPLTGTMRRRIGVETGETDFSAGTIPGNPESHISPAAMEVLRVTSQKEHAPDELLALSDVDLLTSLGLIHSGRITRAGLILAGRENSIAAHLPGYAWTHVQMSNDTDYSNRIDGRDALMISISRILDRIMADNPITTLKHGMFHFEFRRYPEIVLREAIMNAFCHADYRIGGLVIVRQYPDHMEIGNPGGFIGGVSPTNILHHPPIARNPLLVGALTKLRLVNRLNLGVQRMYRYMLIEGKEPPIISEQGDAVTVVLKGGDYSLPIRFFVEEESQRGEGLTVDHLLMLTYLIRNTEIDTHTAAALIQRTEREARNTLQEMETTRGYLERGGTGRSTYWTLRPDLHLRLMAPGHPERNRRIDWEAAKTRILSVLRQRSMRGEGGISNREIRQITHLDRYQVVRLMQQLQEEETHIDLEGKGRGSRYVYRG